MTIGAIGACSSAQITSTQVRSSATASTTAEAIKTDASTMLDAITSALGEIGVGTADSSGDASGTAQALGEFLNKLFQSLQGPEGAPPPPPPAADSSASDALGSSFKNLLTALGVDSSDSDSKLSAFLQALSGKLDGASGNLINTSA
ncbi:MAG: hypothetical protein V4508_12200 [Pseudomonadota bacterium]